MARAVAPCCNTSNELAKIWPPSVPRLREVEVRSKQKNFIAIYHRFFPWRGNVSAPALYKCIHACCLAFSFHLAGRAIYSAAASVRCPDDAGSTGLSMMCSSSGHSREKTLISSLLLHEPPKEKVLAWKDGDRSHVNQTSSLKTLAKRMKALVISPTTSWNRGKRCQGVQAPYTESEFTAAGEIIKKTTRDRSAQETRALPT